MSLHEETIAKIRQLSESQLQQVNDFIDFLLMKNNSSLQPSWTKFSEETEIVESDFSEYLRNLEDYEQRLNKEEIYW
ncbi:MAG: hypothetical protein RMX96_17955 [Nostoc sp. ChiSLP02]|nr:hypothetical protein [Nostoc sp. DedSLP05]MDZ8097585.1 hypothetical protein [Nostoc sp. DedSLP01]MDZ8186720.1 hypothetical protein [Nostoc sp. ChiSLP02]